MFKAPKTILNHPGVRSVHDGEDEGCDTKYYVYFKEGWGYPETAGDYSAASWICGGKALDSVEEFLSLRIHKKP